jgi:hypothetical protein
VLPDLVDCVGTHLCHASTPHKLSLHLVLAHERARRLHAIVRCPCHPQLLVVPAQIDPGTIEDELCIS